MAITQRELRSWQRHAFDCWIAAKKRGIVSVVTGGGKTFFALKCIEHCYRTVAMATALIVVPTEALLGQWLEELSSFFEISRNYLNIVTKRNGIKSGRLNVGVINTAASLAGTSNCGPVFLVVDECHRAASPAFRKILDIETYATLGLSATPERQYDDLFAQLLVPRLGNVIYTYTYLEAMRDGVISAFTLNNILFDFTTDEDKVFRKFTNQIRIASKRHGMDSPEAVRLLLLRARFVNTCPERVRLALKLIARHRGKRVLVFHEDIYSCEAIFASDGVKAG